MFWKETVEGKKNTDPRDKNVVKIRPRPGL